jgi:hypothetical protein
MHDSSLFSERGIETTFTLEIIVDVKTQVGISEQHLIFKVGTLSELTYLMIWTTN